MSVIDRLDPDEVQFVDRTGNIIIFYCDDNIKVSKVCRNIHQASRLLTKYRKRYEGKQVGD